MHERLAEIVKAAGDNVQVLLGTRIDQGVTGEAAEPSLLAMENEVQIKEAAVALSQAIDATHQRLSELDGVAWSSGQSVLEAAARVVHAAAVLNSALDARKFYQGLLSSAQG